MRTACVLVRDVALAAALRSRPERRGTPFVVASGPGPRAGVLAATPEALRAGVRPGASVAQARTACADLAVQVASPALEQSARDALLDAALACSPRVAPTLRAADALAGEAAVFADASGVASLFRSEAGFATALAERCRALGLPAVVGLAGAPEVAQLVARSLCVGELPQPGAVRVLQPGEERAFLDALPLDLLAPASGLLEGLTRLGIRRLGELARLPASALGTRLGPGALRLRALARGEAPARPLPAPEAPRCEESTDLEFPVAHQEGLTFVLRGLLARLLARLHARHLACRALALRLELEGGGRDARRVATAAPTRDAGVLLRLLRLSLETRPPQDAVVAVALAADAAPPRHDQLDLWRPAGPAPATLDALLAELGALCGPERVGAARPRDDWRPDAFALEPFAPPAAAPPLPPAAAPRLALRRLRPPAVAQVHESGGQPAWLRSAAASGRVLCCAGPWRTSGHWWSPEERYAHEHWDVWTEDGSVSRLCHDRLRGGWRVEALYD